VELNQQLNDFHLKINAFFSFILNKLKNFGNLTLGEQISYAIIFAGVLLVLFSIILFMVG